MDVDRNRFGNAMWFVGLETVSYIRLILKLRIMCFREILKHVLCAATPFFLVLLIHGGGLTNTFS